MDRDHCQRKRFRKIFCKRNIFCSRTISFNGNLSIAYVLSLFSKGHTVPSHYNYFTVVNKLIAGTYNFILIEPMPRCAVYYHCIIYSTCHVLFLMGTSQYWTDKNHSLIHCLARNVLLNILIWNLFYLEVLHVSS